MKAQTFEATIRDELLIKKTLGLLGSTSLPLEIEAMVAGINVSDKLAYHVLSEKDVTFSLDESKLKSFWEMQKTSYMTKQMYDLSIVWTESKDAEVSEEELTAHYETTSFNYSDAEGKQLGYAQAKEKVMQSLKLKKDQKNGTKSVYCLQERYPHPK
ncbi:MAG: hypothetical protein Q9M36_01330 [Sulfurovum sp.]|nr:hypothetical protein [Sulfurovum sp.]